MDTLITRTATFEFRPVAAKDSDRHAKLLAAAEAAGIQLVEVYDLAKQKGNNGHQRPAEQYDLPVFTADDFNAVDPQFVADLLNNAVEAAARKMFVDQFKPVELEELTVQAVIAANRPAPRQAGISKELLEAFVNFLAESFKQRNTPKAMAQSVLELVKGKFAASTLAKYSRQLETLPAVLDALESKFLPLAPAEQQGDFKKVIDHFVTNFSNYLNAIEAEAEEVDFTAL